MDLALEFEGEGSSSRAIQAGSTISGSLKVSASKNATAKELLLYLKGKEYTTVMHKGQTSQDQHLILRIDQGVPPNIVQNGLVKEGTYKVPFSFHVPLEVPPSMEITKQGGIRRKECASIAYRIRAVLLGSGNIKDYSVQQEIQIVAPFLNKEPVQTIVPLISQPVVHTLAKKSTGEITCGVKLWDAQMLPGQQAQIQLSMVNDSTASIQSVELALEQEVAWWAANHKPVGSTFHSTSSSEILCSETIPLGTSKLDLETVKERLKDPNRPQTNQQHIQQALNEGSVEVCTLPPVPEALITTFQGQKIGVVHQIRVTLVTDSKQRLTQALPVSLLPGKYG